MPILQCSKMPDDNEVVFHPTIISSFVIIKFSNGHKEIQHDITRGPHPWWVWLCKTILYELQYGKLLRKSVFLMVKGRLIIVTRFGKTRLIAGVRNSSYSPFSPAK